MHDPIGPSEPTTRPLPSTPEDTASAPRPRAPVPATTGRDVTGYVATLLGVLAFLSSMACFHDGASAAHNAAGVGSLGASGACLVIGFRALRRPSHE